MLKIEVRGSTARLTGLERAVGNLDTVMGEISLYMERETRLNFAKEYDPDGVPWAALSPSTLARKKTRAILRETSQLASSVSSTSSKEESRVFITDPKGIYHQTGTTKMPARPILGIGDRQRKNIEKMFRRHFI